MLLVLVMSLRKFNTTSGLKSWVSKFDKHPFHLSEVNHRTSAFHNCTIFLLCCTILFGSIWHGESMRNTVLFQHFVYSFTVEFLATASQQNFCDVTRSLYLFQKFRRQSATSLFVVMKYTRRNFEYSCLKQT